MSQINLKTRQQRIGYRSSDELYYLTSPVVYSKITTEMLVNYASENSGIPKAQMASAFYAISQQIEQFLFNGHSLELSNLGCFYISTKAHAAKEKENAGAKAVYRLSVQFRQSKKLRDLINSNITLVSEDGENGADQG